MRRAGLGLGDHALDLLQLLHQVRLRRQPARGVDEDDVAAARLAGDDGIEAHSGRIAAFLADDLDPAGRPAAAGRAGALGPRQQLLARRGAEGVGGGEQDLLIRVDEVARELADARRLARAVDADDHDHRRRLRADDERPLERLEQLLDAARQQPARRGRVANMRARDAPLQLVEQIDGGLGTGVGLQQRDLEVFVELVADLGADESAGDRPAGALQAALQLGHPAGAVGVARRLGGREAVPRAPAPARAQRRSWAALRRRVLSARPVASAPSRPASCRRTARRHRHEASRARCANAARRHRRLRSMRPRRQDCGGALGCRRGGGRRALAEETEHAIAAGRGGGMGAPNRAARSKRRLRIAREMARYTRGLRRFSSVG